MAPGEYDDGMTELSLATLAGGKLLEAVDEALGRLAKDVGERPGLKKARKLTIEIAMTPTASEDLVIVGVEYTTSEKVPSKVSGGTHGVLSRNGTAIRVPRVDAVQTDIEQYAGVVSIASGKQQ